MKIKIGSRITIVLKNCVLRTYITKIRSNFVQLYDPTKDFSWGYSFENGAFKLSSISGLKRVMYHKNLKIKNNQITSS